MDQQKRLEDVQEIVFAFLKNIREELKLLDPTLSGACKRSIKTKLVQLFSDYGGVCPQDLFGSKSFLERLFFLFVKVLMAVSKKAKKASKYIDMLLSSFVCDKIAYASDENLKSYAKNIVEALIRTLKKTLEDVDAYNACKSEKRCLLVSSLCPPTWVPQIRALQKAGWEVHALLQVDLKEISSYGACLTSETSFDSIYYGKLFEALVFMSYADESPLLFNAESFYGADFEAERAVVLYMITAAFTRTVKQKSPHKNLVFLMYDGLKPVTKNLQQVNQELSKYYKRYFEHVDKIIFNSNGETFGEFVQNAYGVQKPSLHFVRYSQKASEDKPRKTFGAGGDEFHMVSITTCLHKHLDATRDLVPQLIKTVLSQGIHFHYYNSNDDGVTTMFEDSLSSKLKKYFHSYPIDRNQGTLVSEMQQYHVGINPFDYLTLSQGICGLNDRAYQDGMQCYMESTFPTSSLVYAAAGLPIILPRVTHDANKFFNKTIIPLVYSEFSNLKNHLIDIDLAKKCDIARDWRHHAYAETHISKLVEFLEA